MSPATELVGAVLDGKLRIESLLASGAAGDVYEALHLTLGTRVAVKILRDGGGETADIRRKRFLREAQVAARLRSPHVVRVFDVVAGEDLTYLVMERLEGETLADRIKRDGPLPVREAAEYLRQACDALAEMHDDGVVHRDVKPSNLFLERERRDGSLRVKLLDFGVAALRQPVARERDSQLTFSEAFLGTPRYMAPEQVRSSKSVDARADVWALGVTLYEMLTGAPPFDGQTVIAVLNQIERGSIKALDEIRSDAPAGLVELVGACMSRDPDGRPASARALGEALRPFCAESASERREAPSPSPWPRRAAMAVGAMVVASLLVWAFTSRRAGEASSSTAIEALPDLPSPSASSSATLAVDVPAAPTPAPSPSSFPPSASSPVSPVTAPVARPRPRPALPRPIATRPPREPDDRIE
jgi:serine/threonine-protein kinase